ncbi:MAG TPA: hypothetical protein PKE26_02165 [Kiritimatiellia bacterium]|nr:hypothetical protein [Kiritimatiellia bacterium]HMO97894.1 hypothetical protein [Kiritimatiellia bacterium]HMP95586.1 hypothetical protein [Kiritimatiellia bacterium]
MKSPGTSFRWLRWIGLLIGVLIVMLLAVLVLAGPIATPIARKALAENLIPATELDRIEARLIRGFIQIRGLRIAQPDGFGDGDFLHIDRLWIQVRVSSLFGGAIHINDIGAEGLNIHVLKNEDGIMNTARLTLESEPAPDAPATPPDEPSDVAEADTKLPADAVAPSEPSGLAVWVHRIAVRDLAFTYTDQSINPDKPVAIHLRKTDISAHDLVFDPSTQVPRDMVSTLTITGQFEHADTPSTPIGIQVRLGPLTAGIPAVFASVVLTGLELGSVGAMIPPGVAATLGGDVVDAGIRLKLADDVLDVDAVVQTAGARFPIKVSGTPEMPRVDSGAVLLGAFGRVGGLVGNTLGNVAGAGLQVGEGALNVATSAGKGAANIVGGLGRGLFDTVKSAATLDVKGVGDGLVGTVTSVGQGAVDTVTEVGGTAFDTVGQAARTTTGSTGADAWREGKLTRHTPAWEAAQAWVADASWATDVQDNQEAVSSEDLP